MKNKSCTIASNVWMPLLALLFSMLLTSARIATAAVTEITVAQGHTLSGIRHRLFKKSKSASSHTLSADCIGVPPGGNAAQIQVNNIAVVAGSRGLYKFDVHANDGAVEGAYKLRFYDHKTPRSTGAPRTLPTTVTVYVKEIVVVSVSFLDGDTPGLPISILTGPSSDYLVSASEWLNGSKNDPGAYVRGGTKKLKVGLHGPPNTTYEISADGTWDGIESKAITFDNSGVGYSDKFKIVSFPTAIAKADVGWRWKAKRNGVTKSLNDTSHKIYSVLQEQLTGNHYEKIYEFGCGWAQGKTTPAATWTAIWGAITSRTATGYRYYPKSFEGGMIECFFTRQLIWYKEGRCGSFQNLTRDILLAQGLDVDYVNLAVKTPYSWFATCSEGQGGTPQQRQFQDHGIVSYGGNMYDPSYGNGPFSGKQNWADESVDAHRTSAGYPGTGKPCPTPSGDWSANTSGTQVVVTP